MTETGPVSFRRPYRRYSKAENGRIKQGLWKPSPRTLQKIAKPLGFDLCELLVIAGCLFPDASMFSEEQKNQLQAELNVLIERIESDSKRLKQIVNRLLLSR